MPAHQAASAWDPASSGAGASSITAVATCEEKVAVIRVRSQRILFYPLYARSLSLHRPPALRLSRSLSYLPLAPLSAVLSPPLFPPRMLPGSHALWSQILNGRKARPMEAQPRTARAPHLLVLAGGAALPERGHLGNTAQPGLARGLEHADAHAGTEVGAPHLRIHELQGLGSGVRDCKRRTAAETSVGACVWTRRFERRRVPHVGALLRETLGCAPARSSACCASGRHRATRHTARARRGDPPRAPTACRVPRAAL
jgi:hypothetical protein